jgi:predicted ribosomally synthesized peptide with SipW-like signal peptide
MSLRKVAGLIAAFGLTVGLIGGGVSAAFTDQVTAVQHINVGTFGCAITHTTAGSIATGEKSVSYTAADIMSAAAGSAPFTFTVASTGSIPVKLHVTQTVPTAPFTSLLADPVADVTLNVGGTQDYAVGLRWPELTNANLGGSASIVYSVSCVEASTTFTDAVFPSTNSIDKSKGWAYVDATAGSGTLTLTFHQTRAFATCFEYRTDGNVPNQILTANGGVNYNPSIHDGLWPYTCLAVAGSTKTVTLGPTVHFVEVRLSFGAEADERFGWTRFDALP